MSSKRSLGLLGIVVFALSLRTGVSSLSPVAGEVVYDQPLSVIQLGILASIPALAFAVAGIVSGRLIVKFGAEPLVVGSAGLAVVTHLMRGVSPGFSWLFTATVVLMLAVGVGNVVLPVLVKKYAPSAIGAVTSAYTAALAVSTVVPPAFALSVESEWGWRVALGVWSLVSLLATIPWLVLLFIHESAVSLDSSEDLRPPGQSVPTSFRKTATARAILAPFAIASVTAYTMFGLLPSLSREVWGVTPETAAAGLAIFAAIGIPIALVIPRFVASARVVRTLVLVAGALLLMGYAGAIAGLPSLYWWSIVFWGLGTLMFSLSLALVGQRSGSLAVASRLSAWVNGWGYFIAGLGPVVVGTLNFLTGGWTVSLILLAALSVLVVPVAFELGKGTTLEAR